MKTSVIFIFIISSIPVYSQDTIIQKTGNIILCEIQKEDSLKVSFTFKKNGLQIETFLYKNEIHAIHYYIPSKIIVLTNKLNGETMFVHVNKRIKMVFYNDSIPMKGKLIAIKDSVIVINGVSSIKFTDIREIYLNPPTVDQIFGIPLLVSGALGTGFGTFFLGAGVYGVYFEQNATNRFFDILLGFGLGVLTTPIGLATGLLGLKILKKKKYSMQEWSIKVISK
jgi:hypothetical protein